VDRSRPWHYSHKSTRYQSVVTDAEQRVIEVLMSPASKMAVNANRCHDEKIIDRIFYVMRSDCLVTIREGLAAKALFIVGSLTGAMAVSLMRSIKKVLTMKRQMNILLNVHSNAPFEAAWLRNPSLAPGSWMSNLHSFVSTVSDLRGQHVSMSPNWKSSLRYQQF